MTFRDKVSTKSEFSRLVHGAIGSNVDKWVLNEWNPRLDTLARFNQLKRILIVHLLCLMMQLQPSTKSMIPVHIRW